MGRMYVLVLSQLLSSRDEPKGSRVEKAGAIELVDIWRMR